MGFMDKLKGLFLGKSIEADPTRYIETENKMAPPQETSRNALSPIHNSMYGLHPENKTTQLVFSPTINYFKPRQISPYDNNEPKNNTGLKGSMPAKQAGFNRVLDGLKKRQLQHDFQLERAAETYEPIQNIGSGAFGIVCEAKETTSAERVAIKKVAHASATPTLARRTLREIRVLRYIDHPNIVTLRDIFRTKGPLGIDVFLVMDLMDNNLHQIIYGNTEPLDQVFVHKFLVQLLSGLEYLHAASIAHRDLKPSNLLVNTEDATLRIADFGMAKCADKNSKPIDAEEHCFYMTQHVATLPYRAPELLFVMPEHSTAVDMWAVGCIFGEMVMRNEVFPGRSVQSQIKMLLSVLGKPSKNILNEIRCDRTKKLIEDFGNHINIDWDTFVFCQQRGDEQIVYGDCQAVDFVRNLFRYDASERLTIEQALNHPYVKNITGHLPGSPKCPFKVKRDMMYVENLSHNELIELLCKDVRSAENSYREIHSGESTGHSSSISTETSSGECSPTVQQHEMEDISTQVSICETISDA